MCVQEICQSPKELRRICVVVKEWKMLQVLKQWEWDLPERGGEEQREAHVLSKFLVVLREKTVQKDSNTLTLFCMCVQETWEICQSPKELRRICVVEGGKWGLTMELGRICPVGEKT